MTNSDSTRPVIKSAKSLLPQESYPQVSADSKIVSFKKAGARKKLVGKRTAKELPENKDLDWTGLESARRDSKDLEESEDSDREPEELSAALDSMAAHLNRAGKFQLLSREEEAELGGQVQFALKSLKAAAPESAQAKYWSGQLTKARNRMVEANLRLVISAAKSWNKSPVAFEDLVQEGNIALIKAVEKFDPALGNRFSTYAMPAIHGAFRRFIDNNGRLVRIPVNKCERLRVLAGIEAAMAQDLHRTPRVEELAHAIGKERKEVLDLIEMRKPLVSLYQPLVAGTGSVIGETLEDEGAWSPDVVTPTTLLQERLAVMLPDLNPRQQSVMRLLCGFEGGELASEEAVVELLGLSLNQVRAIKQQAMHNLREQLHELQNAA